MLANTIIEKRCFSARIRKSVSLKQLANCRLSRLVVAQLVFIAIVVQLLNCSTKSASAGSSTDHLNGELWRELRHVCRGHDAKAFIVFETPHRLRDMLTMYESHDGVKYCYRGRNKYDDSFKEMRKLIGHDQSDLKDICSQQMYERIREFHLKFIHYYKPELDYNELILLKKTFKKDKLKPIPRSLRTFFILFAKQINSRCKGFLISQLPDVTIDTGLVDEEFKMLDKFNKVKTDLMIEKLISNEPNTSDFNRLQVLNFSIHDTVDYLPDKQQQQQQQQQHSLLAKIFGNQTDANDGDNNNKLYLQVKFNHVLQQFATACLKRFRPIYEPLFVPVIRLNNLGYRDRSNSKQYDHLLAFDKQFYRWYNIIQACEILRDIEVVHDTSGVAPLVDLISEHSPLTNKAKLNKLKILTKSEANNIERKNLDGGEQTQAYDPVKIIVKFRRVSFTPMMWLRKTANISPEMANFKRDLGNIVSRKRSFLRQAFKKTSLEIKTFFNSHKRAVIDKDLSSRLGRFAAFVARHQIAFRILSIIMIIIFISLNVLVFG